SFVDARTSCMRTATGCSHPWRWPRTMSRRCSRGPGGPGETAGVSRARVFGCTGSRPAPVLDARCGNGGPGGPLDWDRAAEPEPAQSKLLQRYTDAHEHAGPQALIEVLHDDARLSISPPTGHWTVPKGTICDFARARGARGDPADSSLSPNVAIAV